MMTNWFYARDGKQTGPLSSDTILRMISTGELDPQKDLGWCEGMADWKPLGQIPSFSTLGGDQPATDSSNPYAAPATTWQQPERPVSGPVSEIEPGSDPLDGTACVSRAWELVKLHAGIIVLTGLVYLGVSMAVEIPFALIENATAPQIPIRNFESFDATSFESQGVTGVMVVHQLIKQLLALFLSLGATRIGLNLVSGKPASVGMIFGEGSKLLRAIGASILYGLMVAIGLILLIVPGIYLALRYGQFLNAIVDRDLGVFEAFEYSSKLTTGNRGNLFVLGLLMFLVTLAGLLACGIGLLVAIPITWLSSFIAYRWLQYGRQAVLSGSPLP